MTYLLAFGALLAWTLTVAHRRWSWWLVGVAALALGILIGLNDSHPLRWVPLAFTLPLLALLGIPALRRMLISAPLLDWFRDQLPTVSATEQEALDAGTVHWDAELFSGKPDWSRLFGIPAPRLSPEEQAFLDGPVEELCRLVNDWKVSQDLGDLSPEAWAYIRGHKFFAMIIPKRYGGLEFSALGHSAVVTKLASRSLTAAVTVMVPNSLGPAKLLLDYGTEAQKDHYLPRLAAGQEIPCFALTGPYAGSDAASMPDTGIVERGSFEGREVLGLRLNFSKRYITLGPVATVIGLAFNLRDPQRLLGGEVERGITLALLPTGLEGLETGRRHVPLNIMFQNGPVRGRDVFIPIDFVIGGVEQVGRGWRMLMDCLADGRAISLPALSAGAGQLAATAAGAYARVRRQFGLPIGRFEGIEEPLARIAGLAYLIDSTRTFAAGVVDAGEKPSVLSAIAKYHLTESMRVVMNDAMDIHGGGGISLGPRNFFGRLYQAVPISITVEGANILTRNLIIFGQGAIRCHPHLVDEIHAAQDADARRALPVFDRALFGHVAFAISNAVRSLWYGLTRATLGGATRETRAPGLYRRIDALSAQFAFVADVTLLVLGGTLKRKERISARLGDVLSEMVLASAVLKRYADDGEPESDWPVARWATGRALHRGENALDDVLRDFPVRWIGWLLRLWIWPLGRPTRLLPNDRMDYRAASALLGPTPTRERLGRGIFRPHVDSGEALAVLEQAFHATCTTEELESRLRKDLGRAARGLDGAGLAALAAERGLITAPAADELRRAETLRREVVQVDDFADAFGRQA